ncbi:MbtH family NRPS accessory protein [Nocardia takedensis]|uniref:MbtH family NRPS accessory protein n=1 Tax=Nocardia takedensis TaxID=259390 RepID=UPI00031D9F08|nr:MbtH family NRPS accessory protein [Nocardia takedensis]
MNERPTVFLEGAQETFLVLLDARERYALWPSFAELPAGSRVVSGAASRFACQVYLEVADTGFAF